MADAGMGDASMDADLGFDPALAAQALPGEQPLGPRRIPSIVTIGWLVLGLVVASVIGTLVLAPSAVMSVLPGAARLYALFGAPVGAHGLGFEGVRYGWTSEGGQTVLEVQGDVVNLTAAPVDVPTVVIALRDESGEEISEWTTEVGESNHNLIYLCAYESMAEREQKWGAFSTDPEWIAKRAETEKNGPLVMTFSNQFLKPTSFSSVK